LTYTEKQNYRQVGPGKTWEQVTNMDIDHFIDELKGLKDEYETGPLEVKNEITKKVRKIFEVGHEHKYMGHEIANWGGRGLGYMFFNAHLCNQPCYCQSGGGTEGTSL
jgi:hypothetical protein